MHRAEKHVHRLSFDDDNGENVFILFAVHRPR